MHQISADWRLAPLSLIDKALCEYAVMLTKNPAEMNEQHVVDLRDLGLNDRAIHDATQVISYFNYINRVADALGVEPETFIRPWEESAEPIGETNG